VVVPIIRRSLAPRPREGGARMVAAGGRHGTGRDDGGGDSDDGGDPPQSRLSASNKPGLSTLPQWRWR
jgi:hypothetical protein